MPQLEGVWRAEVQMSVGAEVWKNHMDIMNASLGENTPPAPTDDIIDGLVDFFLALHYPDTTVDKVILREIWYKQGAPPHPEHFPIWERTVGGTGSGNSTFGGTHNANSLPKDVAIFCKKTTTGAKPGKMFMRNILTEVDVQASLSGVWSFQDHAGGWQTSQFDSVVDASLSGFFTSPPDSGDWCFAVTHLENIPNSDARTPSFSIMTDLKAIRPVWNDARR